MIQNPDVLMEISSRWLGRQVWFLGDVRCDSKDRVGVTLVEWMLNGVTSQSLNKARMSLGKSVHERVRRRRHSPDREPEYQ